MTSAVWDGFECTATGGENIVPTRLGHDYLPHAACGRCKTQHATSPLSMKPCTFLPRTASKRTTIRQLSTSNHSDLRYHHRAVKEASALSGASAHLARGAQRTSELDNDSHVRQETGNEHANDGLGLGAFANGGNTRRASSYNCPGRSAPRTAEVSTAGSSSSTRAGAKLLRFGHQNAPNVGIARPKLLIARMLLGASLTRKSFHDPCFCACDIFCMQAHPYNNICISYSHKLTGQWSQPFNH